MGYRARHRTAWRWAVLAGLLPACQLSELVLDKPSPNNTVLFAQSLKQHIPSKFVRKLVFVRSYTHTERICEGTDAEPASLAVSFDVSMLEPQEGVARSVYYITSMNLVVHDAVSWSIVPIEELSSIQGYGGGSLLNLEEERLTVVSSYFTCTGPEQDTFTESLHIFGDGDVMNVRPDLSE